MDDNNIRLIPMDEAPRDGSSIIVKQREDGVNRYRLCKWVKPYRIYSNCGAWEYLGDCDCIGHITEQQALGWMHEPESA